MRVIDHVSITITNKLIRGIMKEIISFDYGHLQEADRLDLEEKTNQIKTVIRRTAEGIIEIGFLLSQVRDKLAIQGDSSITKNQGFQAWLKTEFNWSRQTAYNFIRVYEVFGEETQSLENIGAQALYLLAQPSTPQEVREKALEAAQNTRLTKNMVTQFKERHQEFIDSLREAEHGDYLIMHDGEFVFVEETFNNSLKVVNIATKEEAVYSIDHEWKLFSELVAIDFSDWVSCQIIVKEENRIRKYKGWGIYFITDEIGDIVEVQVSNSDTTYWYLTPKKIQALFIDRPWHIKQAIKLIELIEKQYPRPTIRSWSTQVDFQGTWVANELGFDFYLIFQEDSELIQGIYFSDKENSYQAIADIDFNFNSDFPQIHWDQLWWLDEAKKFAASLPQKEEETDKESSYPKKNRPTGHLHARLKDKGENTPPHPDYSNWQLKDACFFDFEGEEFLGEIIGKDNAYAHLKYTDKDNKSKSTTASYSELRRHSKFSDVPASFHDTIVADIEAFASLSIDPNNDQQIMLSDGFSSLIFFRGKTKKKAEGLMDYIQALVEQKVPIPKNWRKEIQK